MRSNNNEACNNTTACLKCHATVNNKQMKFSHSMTVVVISAIVHGALDCIKYADYTKTAFKL